MSKFYPLRKLPENDEFGENDVLVVFGELFSRGYATGIVEQARKRGMKVIYSTMGRREQDGTLRALTSQELEDKEQPLINIPLEAGFDLEPSSQGITPVDQLAGVKLKEWESATLDWQQVEESRRRATERFRENVKAYIQEVDKHIPHGANVIFAHTMAGGVPRAKIVMPAMNRVFKGYGERYTSSEKFWNSEIGRLCAWNFEDVTGQTLNHLIELSHPLRERIQSEGGKVNYTAYGYHGTEVLVNGEYRWQSYSPYLQGWAKLVLENAAKEAWQQNIHATVFNAPEILTNSSSIFLGVEVSLYPLLGALKKEGSYSRHVTHILEKCAELLQEGIPLEDITQLTDEYFNSAIMRQWSDFKAWPQHNGPEQMKLMRESSLKLIDWHKDKNYLITHELSEVVFRACGEIMLCESWQPRAPVVWIGHDAVARQTTRH